MAKSKKIDIVNGRSVTILCGIGGLLHWVGYHLEEITIRDESWMWISMAITSVLGGLYFIIKMNLLDNKSYTGIAGLKLKLYKAAVCVIMLVGCLVMFGAYLNCLVLGANYLVPDKKEEIVSFDIVKISSSKPGLKRRSSERVPLILFSDGKLTDQIELTGEDFDGFDKDVSKIEFVSVSGLFGLGVIKSVDFQ